MYKRMALNGLAIVGLAFGAAAHAEVAPGFYAGASVGKASIEVDDFGFDSSDTSFKVFGGYSFNQHFGVELAWFDGGNPDEQFGPVAVEVELTGLNASAVGRLPINDTFTLFGKAGFTSYDAELSARFENETFSDDDSDVELSVGVGAELNFSQFGVRAEYEMVDASVGEFNLLSVGGVFRF